MAAVNSTAHSVRADLTPRIDDSDALTGKAGKRYRPDPGLIEAVNVALTLERPLLLTGEPGCGKTEVERSTGTLIVTRDSFRRRRLCRSGSISLSKTHKRTTLG